MALVQRLVVLLIGRPVPIVPQTLWFRCAKLFEPLMNYRHAYHAGNFADVVKHAVLALIVEHLKHKPAPFRIIDTHAGIGVYNLEGIEAQKTSEWRDGIGRLLIATPPPMVAEILASYLSVVRAVNEEAGERLSLYPGSPLIARRLLREGDWLVVNEAHAEDCETLRELFHRDKQTKVLALDGWTALKSLLPPKERRGLVLVDPPFEEPGEFERMVEGIREAARRFATGTLMMWHPIKDTKAVERFRRHVVELGVPKVLSVELLVRPARTTTEFVGSGLVILNPPFTLPEKLNVLMPWLVAVLGRGAGASFSSRWLTGERLGST